MRKMFLVRLSCKVIIMIHVYFIDNTLLEFYKWLLVKCLQYFESWQYVDLHFIKSKYEMP